MPTTTPADLSQIIKQQADQLGFELVGIAPAVTPTGIHHFVNWVDRGCAGEMSYIPKRREAYQHPQFVMEGVRSIVMLGINYNPDPPLAGRSEPPRPTSVPSSAAEARSPKIARYARGSADYHDVLRGKLKQLAKSVKEHSPGCRARGVVDTAPLLERDFARLAGLGWFGKNTMLINKRIGSWFFLAGLLVDIELECDQPHQASHCGSCTRCLDACPTNAFSAPYVLDARKCISYLTIELRGSIPEELRDGMGDWLFGCDVCQEVCPWNRKAPATQEPAFAADEKLAAISTTAILNMTDDDFEQAFGPTPLARSRRTGLMRNAAVVAGNNCENSSMQGLNNALQVPDDGVVAAARWAIDKIERSGHH